MLVGYRWWFAAKRPAQGWHLQSIAMRPTVWWDGPHLQAPTPPRSGGCWCWDGESLTCLGLPQCECGIHAYKSEQLVLSRGREFDRWAIRTPQDGYPVWGTVALWGEVVEHEDGYRSEHAMIQRLVVPCRIVVRSTDGVCQPGLAVSLSDLLQPQDVEALGRHYGVEVEVGEGIEVSVEG
jgi:hypothetical protein